MAGRQSSTSGNGGGKAGGGGGGSDDCDIIIDCDLSGIRPEVLAHVAEGDQLTLRLEPGTPYRSVVCVTTNGEVLGALTGFLGHGQLITCMDRGVAYTVAIQTIRTGQCRVVGGITP